MSLPTRAVTCWTAAVLAITPVGTTAQAPARPQMPLLPLTQLDERGTAADLDNRAFTLTFAQPVAIKDLLLLLVRGTSLSIIPDPEISGSFIGELKNVTVRRALELILPPLDLDYSVEGGFLRVFQRAPETRIFDINYIATERTGTSSVGGASGGAGSSSATVSSLTKTDLFAELTTGVRGLASAGATFNIDRKAGLLQVTDFPERLDRVADYLDRVHDRVYRQVQLDARVVEVELNDPNSAGLDWTVLATQLTGTAGATAGAQRPPVTGLRVTDVPRFMALLAAQGKVATLDSPRLVALNNEPTLVRSEALTMSVTPQIASDGTMMLSLSPLATRPTVAESDTLARVADGETIVIAGFLREREVRERRNVGIAGGWFGRGTVVIRKKVQLLFLLTPKILFVGGSG